MCENCQKEFNQKSHLDVHKKRKRPCKKDPVVARLESKVKTLQAKPKEVTTQNMLSLFSGAGGDTCGFEAASWKVTHFSEFKEPAIQTHLAAFPSSTLLKGKDSSNDIKAIPDETYVSLRGGTDLIFAGFPCFVAGTQVLTDTGYKSIETVTLENKLLTHTGKFKPIVNLQRKLFTESIYDIRIKYHPTPLTATPEHPFYVRKRGKEPEWKALKDISMDDFCGMVINRKSNEPFMSVSEVVKHIKKYQDVPEWVQDCSCDFVKKVIDNFPDMRFGAYTVSLHFQRLFLKLGKVMCIKKEETQYSLEQFEEADGFIENNYAWMAPAYIEKRHPVQTEVYNFEVEEDNSYIVENTIVHNCQGFSHAGKKKSDDPRNELVHQFVRAARLIQPKWIIGENVKGLLSRKGVYPTGTAQRPVIDIIREIFEAIGYKITYRVINATEVGVPQERKRLIIIGHKGEQYPHAPWESMVVDYKPTIRNILTDTLEGAVELPELYKPSEQPARYWIETRETPSGTPHPNLLRLVGGIRNLSTKEKQAMKRDVKEKIQYVEKEGLISFGVRKGGYHGQVLDPDAASKTIICAYNQCPRLFVGLHNPDTNKYYVRCLTSVECGEIQGFPKSYPWQGTEKDKIVQIGNAVPPPLATAIANMLPSITFTDTQQICEQKIGKGDESDEEDDE